MTFLKTGSTRVHSNGHRGQHGQRWFGAGLATLLVLSAAACTALLDRRAAQCQTDGDCASFGAHPYCQNGACVSSGLGPTNCFYGTPQQPSDFLNQCSNAQCLSFDNCTRLGLCGDASDLDAALVSPPAPEASTTTPSSSGGSDAGGMPSCADPSNGRSQLVYLTGSSNFPPLLAKLAPLIIAAGYTPVFQVSSSCNGVNTMFSGDPSARMMNDPNPAPGAKYAAYFTDSGSSVPCMLGTGGVTVDVGESDVFSTTCNTKAMPNTTIGEYLGPVQAMLFAVPGKSDQTAITAEAARAVFGMGGDNVSPWTDPTLYFVRNANTGTQQMIAHAIGVPASAFWGVDRGTASNVDSLLRSISDDKTAQEAIGIISADYYDSDRANVKALAFKAPEQDCAYLPDSNAFKKDKQNVRDGHYPIWGPMHFFTTLAGGVPASPGAQAFVNVVSVPNLAKALVDAFIGASLVPDCAMSVQRQTELGPISAYSPPFQCGCYFEASPDVNGTPSPGCTPCNTAAECTNPARPACNLGYCEVQ
jgi:ABC-type phosphate transport system substrate-binding protein